MKKIVLKLELLDEKAKKKALKTVSTLPGIIDSITIDMKVSKLTVIGTVDPLIIVSKLRKHWPTTDIIYVGRDQEQEQDREQEKKEESKREVGKKDRPKKEKVDNKEEPKEEEEMLMIDIVLLFGKSLGFHSSIKRYLHKKCL